MCELGNIHGTKGRFTTQEFKGFGEFRTVP
jgi:hypothetical protein